MSDNACKCISTGKLGKARLLPHRTQVNARLGGSLAFPVWGLPESAKTELLRLLLIVSTLLSLAATRVAGDLVLAPQGAFPSLTEPPCSYCSTQDRKGLIREDDRVIAWIRGPHNGGAVPLRHFLSGTRVINDTYGLFFYDPDGGYVAAYRKDYGYELHGWRRGVMIVRGRDGTLWSALTGKAIEGPQQGNQLERIPSLVTDWGYWLMLHPESTAYDLFEGTKYKVVPLPTEMSDAAQQSMGEVNSRLPAMQLVMGVTVGDAALAFPIDENVERACFLDRVGETDVAVFWYGPTKSAVAFQRELNGQTLTFDADEISPESAPFKDRETGTRWTVAGRGIDGPLRGQELQWVDSIQCRWYAWSAEHPETRVHETSR